MPAASKTAGTYLRLLRRTELAEDCCNALALRVADSAELVARVSSDQCAGNVRDDKSNTSTAGSSEPGPPWSVAFDFWTQKLSKS